MLQKVLTIFAILLISINPLQAVQRAPQLDIKSVVKENATGPALKPGEHLTYSVKWNDLAAAKVLMATEVASDKQRGDAYRVEIKVNTVGMVKDIIQVSDRFAAFIDPKTLLPFRAEREILEGPKTEEGFTIFDQNRHLATVADEKAVPIAPQTHDIASLFWAIRNINLKTGTNEKIQAFNSGEKKMFATLIEVGKREEITTATGTFQAVQLSIKLQEQKQPSDKYAIRMWVTDDAERLPVLITAQPPFGKVRMELIDSGTDQGTENESQKPEVKNP